MTINQLFETVKSIPQDVIFSFRHGSPRYQLAAISVGVLDPMVGLIRGAVIICFDPRQNVREDRYHFKLITSTVYVWAFKMPKTTKK